jgi:small conductance mechanosensitive channel
MILNIWGLQAFEFITSNATLLRPVVRIPLIVIIALLLMNMMELFISRLERRVSNQMLARGKVSMIEVGKRVSTLGRIVSKVAFFAIGLISVMMILEELGFDIKPILAGAGVLGLAVGFGAQNLVKDIISGLFLIVENRIRVGDIAIINGTGGLVEQVNPRTTVLRSQDGTVHVFPNGTITTLSNMTYEFSFYVFDVGVAYKEDTDRVIQVLREISDEAQNDEELGPSILEPMEILGVDQFADSAVMIKARIKTVPIKQWAVGREMNRRIKKRFDELGIEIPFPQRSLQLGQTNGPISVKIEGAPSSREELKQVVAEVLRECGLAGSAEAQLRRE